MKNSLISLIQKKICTAPVVQTVPYQNEQCSVFHSVTLLTEPIYFSCEEKYIFAQQVSFNHRIFSRTPLSYQTALRYFSL